MSAGRLGKSDHEVLLIELDMAGEAGKRRERVKNWRKVNWTGMREELRDRDWAGEMEGLNGEEAWQLLQEFQAQMSSYVLKYSPPDAIPLGISEPCWQRCSPRSSAARTDGPPHRRVPAQCRPPH